MVSEGLQGTQGNERKPIELASAKSSSEDENKKEETPEKKQAQEQEQEQEQEHKEQKDSKSESQSQSEDASDSSASSGSNSSKDESGSKANEANQECDENKKAEDVKAIEGMEEIKENEEARETTLKSPNPLASSPQARPTFPLPRMETEKPLARPQPSPVKKGKQQARRRVGPRRPSNFTLMQSESKEPMQEHTHEHPHEQLSPEAALPVVAAPQAGRRALEFDEAWALILFVCSLFNFFLFWFYLGIPGHPSGFILFCELLSEALFVFDASLITTLFYRQRDLLQELPLLRLQSWWGSETAALVIRWLTSFPQHTLFVMAQLSESTLSSFALAVLRGLKLLRYPELSGYLSRQLQLVRGRRAVFVKGLQYVLSIFLMVHAIALLWLTVVRVEPEPRWMEKHGYTKASSLEKYTEGLFLVTSNMGGMCFGEALPQTNYERLTYSVIVIIGCTSLAALFGSLANSISISNARTIESRRKLEQITHFASTRGLPEELKRKLKRYYATMQIEFSDYGT